MPLTISQVATAAGVNVQTIRYYERRGLFPSPRRTPSGQELLGLRIRHGAACDTVARKTRAKIGLVQQKIAGLERVKRTLERLAAACAARRPTDECPILDTLEDHADAND